MKQAADSFRSAHGCKLKTPSPRTTMDGGGGEDETHDFYPDSLL